MQERHVDQLSRPQAWRSQYAIRTEKEKHENKKQVKIQHEAPRGKNHKATQNRNNTRTTALERR